MKDLLWAMTRKLKPFLYYGNERKKMHYHRKRATISPGSFIQLLSLGLLPNTGFQNTCARLQMTNAICEGKDDENTNESKRFHCI